MKGANVKNEKVNKGDADINDGFDNDKGNEAKNKPKVDTKAGGRETLPIRGVIIYIITMDIQQFLIFLIQKTKISVYFVCVFINGSSSMAKI